MKDSDAVCRTLQDAFDLALHFIIENKCVQKVVFCFII